LPNPDFIVSLDGNRGHKVVVAESDTRQSRVCEKHLRGSFANDAERGNDPERRIIVGSFHAEFDAQAEEDEERMAPRMI
jgi:hypothetical protein